MTPVYDEGRAAAFSKTGKLHTDLALSDCEVPVSILPEIIHVQAR
jgi:hypothetical protein